MTRHFVAFCAVAAMLLPLSVIAGDFSYSDLRQGIRAASELEDGARSAREHVDKKRRAYREIADDTKTPSEAKAKFRYWANQLDTIHSDIWDAVSNADQCKRKRQTALDRMSGDSCERCLRDEKCSSKQQIESCISHLEYWEDGTRLCQKAIPIYDRQVSKIQAIESETDRYVSSLK